MATAGMANANTADKPKKGEANYLQLMSALKWYDLSDRQQDVCEGIFGNAFVLRVWLIGAGYENRARFL